MPPVLGMLSCMSVYLLRSQNKKQLTLILCLIYIDDAADTISQKIFYELEYFSHCRESRVLKSQRSCFVILILSALILCIYPDHVTIVNVTDFIPSKQQDFVQKESC